MKNDFFLKVFYVFYEAKILCEEKIDIRKLTANTVVKMGTCNFYNLFLWLKTFAFGGEKLDCLLL